MPRADFESTDCLHIRVWRRVSDATKCSAHRPPRAFLPRTFGFSILRFQLEMDQNGLQPKACEMLCHDVQICAERFFVSRAGPDAACCFRNRQDPQFCSYAATALEVASCSAPSLQSTILAHVYYHDSVLLSSLCARVPLASSLALILEQRGLNALSNCHHCCATDEKDPIVSKRNAG